ncbi:MAG: rane-flanked domain protein [Frankiales bacterium]|nr:rane-flanked domain protein [Frankiales bacterium]
MTLDDEDVLLDLRPHAKALVLPVLALLLVVGAAGFAAAQLGHGPVVGVVAALLLVRLSLVPFLRWRATRFLLTDERLALRSGVLTRTGRDVPLSRVDEVTFTQTLLQRLQRCGTLVVAAGDAEPFVVRDLGRVEAVQRAVYRQVDAVRR